MSSTASFTSIMFVIFLLVQAFRTPLTFAQSDWPSFNRDSSNSSFTPLKGDMNLKNPRLKWVKDIPDLWTGFTFSSQGGFLAFTPLKDNGVILLDPLTGDVKARLYAPERTT
ncbi:MAG: hypothetical protein ACK4WF_02025, partial [Candidatus Brocadiales bacterium]